MAEDTVTLTRAQYSALLDQIEDLQASLTLDKARHEDDDGWTPGEVVNGVFLEGLHPVAAWRKYRGMTVRDLARASGVSAAYISEIESGKKPGSVSAYRSLSRSLDASLDSLIPNDD